MRSAMTPFDVVAGPYKDTVNLPQTSFNMRANSIQREPQIQKFWQDNKVYEGCLQDDSKVCLPAYTCCMILRVAGKRDRSSLTCQIA